MIIWVCRLSAAIRVCGFLSSALVSSGQATGTEYFSIKQEPVLFSRPAERLRQLVTEKKTKAPRNHFCIVGFEPSPDRKAAYIDWREGNALILWEPSGDPSDPTTLAQSRRYWHLDRDVVESEQQVNGSIVAITKQQLTEIVTGCKKYGDSFIIRR